MSPENLKQKLQERIVRDLGAEKCALTVLTVKAVLSILERYSPGIIETIEATSGGIDAN